MNYAILKTELADAKYLAMTNQEVADSLNLPDPAILDTRLVNFRAILAEVIDGGIVLDAIESAAAASPDIKWALYGIKSDGIDIGHPKTQAQVDALVAGNVLTSAQGNALKAMAPKQSRAQQLGVPVVSISHVQHARTL